MNHRLKKRFIVVLALLVGLLPFSFSYGFGTDSADAHPPGHQHKVSADDCDQNAGCTDLVTASSTDDDCCSDKCDSSFGNHLALGIEYGLQLPSGRQYQESGRFWRSGPIPPTLLRPPPVHS